MPADPVAAGKKGGASRSEAKLAACRRNGFQKVKQEQPAAETEQPTVHVFTPEEEQ
jgi:hypothetical protein